VRLSENNITQFQSLYLNRLGKETTKEEAYELGVKLLSLVDIVYTPMSKDEFAQILARQKLISKLSAPN
jgi:hypothetical protein